MRRCSRAIINTVIGILVVGALALTAEAQAQAVRAGDRVRVEMRLQVIDTINFRPDRGVTVHGVFRRNTDRDLEIDVAQRGTVTVSLDSIARLSVARDRTRGQGARRGALIGAVAGFTLGFVIGVTNPEPDAGPLISEPVDTGLLAGVALGVPATVLGVVIGASSPGTRWERLSVSTLRQNPFNR